MYPSSDEIAVRQVCAGDVSAFASLYERHRNSVYAYCYRLLRDTGRAEDALQNVFTRALESIRTLDEPSAFKFWLFIIARNEVYGVIRKLRSPNRLILIDESDELWDSETPLTYAVQSNEVQIIPEQLGQLKPEYREVLILREYEQFSYTEPIAADWKLHQRFSSSIIPRSKSAQSLWNQRITLRFPVLALLLCLIAAGAVLVFSGRSPFYEPETVYVMSLPAVVIPFVFRKGAGSYGARFDDVFAFRDVITDILKGEISDSLKKDVDIGAYVIIGNRYEHLYSIMFDPSKSGLLTQGRDTKANFSATIVDDSGDSALFVIKTNSAKGKTDRYHSVVLIKSADGRWKIRGWHTANE